MDFVSLVENFKINLRNLPGWTTNRKIIVLESDDWGSVRMSSKEAFESLKFAGISHNENYFIANDALESNSDLAMLFDVLSNYKDKTGRNPVFTGACVIANPNFEKIKANDFSKYEYEPFTETCDHYPMHDQVLELWKEGIQKRIFVPVFHGREHLNVQRWIRALQSGDKAHHFAFEHGIFGLSKGFNGEKVADHLAAFDIEFPSDSDYLTEVICTGTKLFEEICGYSARYFVPPNSPGNNAIESTLLDCGIEFLNSGRIFLEPYGDGKYVKRINWLGKHNKLGQVYLTRNCFFEPVSTESTGKDWVNDCLHEIDVAFGWHKPAIVSTHRVNYIGYINPKNRDKGLKSLDKLLITISKRWPDVEFLTSVELGDLIKESNQF